MSLRYFCECYRCDKGCLLCCFILRRSFQGCLELRRINLMDHNLIIRATCRYSMLALRRHLWRPVDRINCSEVSVSDLTNFLIIIFCHTPNDPSFVFTATHKVGSSGIKVEAPHSRRVPSDRIFAHPFVHWIFVWPSFYCVIIAGWEKLISIGVPLNVFDILLVAWKYAHASILKLLTWIFLKYPDAFITRASRHVVTLRAPCDTLHFVFMTFEYLAGFKVSISIIFASILHP